MLVQPTGVLLISIRVSFLPIAILCSVILPVFLWRSGVRALLILITIGFVLSQSLLFGYRHLYASLIDVPLYGHPAYSYDSGFFLISDFSSIIEPVDDPIKRLRAEVFNDARYPLGDFRNREAQRWYADGICGRIVKLRSGKRPLNILTTHTS